MSADGAEPDEALMQRYCGGDLRAFEVLVARHRQPIYNFILRFVRDRAQAEDLLQETFLRMVKSADAYERQAKLTTWLYTIARNLCVDAARRGRHRRTASLDAPVGEEGGAVMLDFVADSTAGAELKTAQRELGERIRSAVSALPDEQREVFLLREVADLPFEEIAAVVGSSENTVKSRMRYALEKLREALAEYRDAARAAP